PRIAKEWDYSKNGNLTPNDVSIGTHKKAWWICVKGHSWQAEIKTRRNSGCPICAGRILPGFNDLAASRPDLMKYWDYKKNVSIEPSKLGCHSKKNVFWKCPECGEEWQSMICNITKRKTIHKCKK
ncbi:MAG: zinc-ribbon domain-containing protein, partial [Clostridia bacterium]|nr:zinc-ribbon domain-containing protein [Clostridia bacterium]